MTTVRRSLDAVCRVHVSLNGLNQSVALMVSHTSRLATPDVRTHSETTSVLRCHNNYVNAGVVYSAYVCFLCVFPIHE